MIVGAFLLAISPVQGDGLEGIIQHLHPNVDSKAGHEAKEWDRLS